MSNNDVHVIKNGKGQFGYKNASKYPIKKQTHKGTNKYKKTNDS